MPDEKAKSSPTVTDKTYRSYPVASTPSKEFRGELVDEKHDYTLENGGAGFGSMEGMRVEKLALAEEKMPRLENKEAAKQLHDKGFETKPVETNKTMDSSKQIAEEPRSRIYQKAENAQPVRGWSEKICTENQYLDHLNKKDINTKEYLEFDKNGGHVHYIEGVVEKSKDSAKKAPMKDKELELE